MAKTERVYNVPLRKGFHKAVRYKKARKALTTLRSFLARHMKCSEEQVKIGKVLNHKLWEHGIKNPPHHVKVTAIKDDDGIVKAELFGNKYEEPVKQVEKEEKESDKKSEKEVKEVKEVADKDVKELEAEVDDVLSEDKAEKEEPKKKSPAKKPTAKKTVKKETKEE